MPKRRVSTAARLAALGNLIAMRPRTSMATLAQLVDGVAELVEAGQPDTTVRMMLAGLRLSADQEAKVLAVMLATPKGATNGDD